MSAASQKSPMAGKPTLVAGSFPRNSLRRTALAVSSTGNLGGTAEGSGICRGDGGAEGSG